ncbi:MAG: enoyl-CoA hydratase-related protein [Burkholderiaceae bacterium]
MSDILLVQAGVVAWVTLSNPGKLNALDVNMWRQLATVFNSISADSSVRCVILCGENGQFAAGADIEEFFSERATSQQGTLYHTVAISEALSAVSGCRHPTIAAIEGVCVGGGLEIASACDLRIAAPDARFGIPINALGFALAPDEMNGLLELVGRAVTLEMLLEGRVFDASEALQKGLITRIASDVSAAAQEAALRIARGAPLAAQMTKSLVNRLAPRPAPLTATERDAVFALLDSADYREGVLAFLAKRRPMFSGR